MTIREYLIQRWRIEYPTYKASDFEIISEFVFYGSMRIILLWLEDKICFTVDELANYLLKLEKSCCNSQKSSK